ALGLAGASTSFVIAMLALGAAGVFLGVTLLSPLFAEQLTRALGWPVRKVFGVPGQLAQQNAGRNPCRTATTAAALMIGLAMVSMALVVGQSLKAQLRATLESSVQADYLVTEATENRFPDGLEAAIADRPEIDTVTGFSYLGQSVDGVDTEWVATDLRATDELFDLGITSGSAYDPNVANPVLISDEEAAASNLTVGDRLPFLSLDGATTQLEVIGVFTDDVIIEEEFLTDDSVFTQAGYEMPREWMALSTVDGVAPEQTAGAFAALSTAFPTANFDTFGDYVEQLEGFVDQALTALNVLVALAVIIALIGIANALALSVFERTRELGLLRAVGMTRRQVRSMVRFEAGLVALFGATLGVVTGVGFGWAAVEALPDSLTSTLAIPTGRIVLLVAVAAAAGLVAAWGPARRAGKLPILDAIAG
ncbi:MAG: ABC transporter permease, partial [Acidimicrobiales bacterium]|nr:ABC transporter permease [Acidimicrobiales bacterium]